MTNPTFLKVKRGAYVPNESRNVIVLKENNWDDYGFKTMFYASYIDAEGSEHPLGDLKIGYVEQDSGWTSEKMPVTCPELPEGFFSLGQSAEYYSQLRLSVPDPHRVLAALHDLAAFIELRSVAYNTKVFENSLTRSVSIPTIEKQFYRIAHGGVVLTPFDFRYHREPNEHFSGVTLDFKVEPDSKPPTNIHVLIGRNGVGKTTILNGMTFAIVQRGTTTSDVGGFYTRHFFADQPISNDYFSSLSSVSFSAFDPFDPPPDQRDRSKGPSYFYIGLKKTGGSVDGAQASAPKLRDFDDLAADFTKSLRICMSQEARRNKWLKCISILESDPNFEEMQLQQRAAAPSTSDGGLIHFFRHRMSSGHAVVLLTITKLVETVEEKALVIIDEPESHLHPPLLAAFTRALSYLLAATNAIAIIATHSPVVLQEVPRHCAWKLRRARLQAVAERPERETFGENVGILTREVFGLEVSKSGFHALLAESVAKGGTFDEVLAEYAGQIGIEGQTIVRSLVSARDSNKDAS